MLSPTFSSCGTPLYFTLFIPFLVFEKSHVKPHDVITPTFLRCSPQARAAGAISVFIKEESFEAKSGSAAAFPVFDKASSVTHMIKTYVFFVVSLFLRFLVCEPIWSSASFPPCRQQARLPIRVSLSLSVCLPAHLSLPAFLHWFLRVLTLAFGVMPGFSQVSVFGMEAFKRVVLVGLGDKEPNAREVGAAIAGAVKGLKGVFARKTLGPDNQKQL